MSEMLGSKDDMKAMVKELITRLNGGENHDQVKEEFKNIVRELSPQEVARIESEMIKGRMPREVIHELCDVHLEPLKDALQGPVPLIPESHPLRILLGEHREFLKAATQLRIHAQKIKEAGTLDDVATNITVIRGIIDEFKKEELHYQREENVLFPYLEKHGVTQPPAIMWADHDRIREMKKGITRLLDEMSQVSEKEFNEFGAMFLETVQLYHETITSHFHKENNILFPASVQLVERREWRDISKQFDDIGYFKVLPPEPTGGVDVGDSEGGNGDVDSDGNGDSESADISEGGGKMGGKDEVGEKEKRNDEITFLSGSIRMHEIEPILNSLPIDMTFVDKDDKVRYFSLGKDRIFIRTNAIIGREVANCHPPKSLHVVSEIVSDFKSGKRDSAEFWLNLDGKMVYIRYYAVRDKKGEYLGTVEVSQDITDIQKITGEKRILD